MDSGKHVLLRAAVGFLGEPEVFQHAGAGG